MELRQLRYFVKSAETLNFSDAAKALNIVQSTMSQQIRQLEEEMGVLLFERGARSLRLTEAGEVLLSAARDTLRDADMCVARLQDLRDMISGTLNIGITYSFSPILTETIVEFMKRYPHVRLNIFYKPMAELMDMLRERTVDFVLAFRPSVSDTEMESHVLFDNHLAAIVADGHPLCDKQKISIQDLQQYDLALPTRGLQARNAFDSLLARSEVNLKIRMELNEVNILLKLVKQTRLVTVLAEATIYNEKGVKAIPLDIPGNEMDGCVHMLRDTYRKHSSIEFIRMLKESNAVRERVRDWFL